MLCLTGGFHSLLPFYITGTTRRFRGSFDRTRLKLFEFWCGPDRLAARSICPLVTLSQSVYNQSIFFSISSSLSSRGDDEGLMSTDTLVVGTDTGGRSSSPWLLPVASVCGSTLALGVTSSLWSSPQSDTGEYRPLMTLVTTGASEAI